MRELRIGSLILDNPFFLAPLAGITDAPMRRLCREQGASLVFSEMVSGKGLWYKDKNTARLLETYEEERPVAFQIFGHEPQIMAFTARELTKLPCAAIDINMGCPVPKIVKNGEGSALLKDPDLVYDVVSAVVKNTDKPVTVKNRLGQGHYKCRGDGSRHICRRSFSHNGSRQNQRAVLQRKSRLVSYRSCKKSGGHTGSG